MGGLFVKYLGDPEERFVKYLGKSGDPEEQFVKYVKYLRNSGDADGVSHPKPLSSLKVGRQYS